MSFFFCVYFNWFKLVAIISLRLGLVIRFRNWTQSTVTIYWVSILSTHLLMFWRCFRDTFLFLQLILRTLTDTQISLTILLFLRWFRFVIFHSSLLFPFFKSLNFGIKRVNEWLEFLISIVAFFLHVFLNFVQSFIIVFELVFVLFCALFHSFHKSLQLIEWIHFCQLTKFALKSFWADEAFDLFFQIIKPVVELELSLISHIVSLLSLFIIIKRSGV